MAQPLSPNGEFVDTLAKETVSNVNDLNLRKAQNQRNASVSAAVLNQFLDTAPQNIQSDSANGEIQHVDISNDGKNVVIVMQQSLNQHESEGQPVLQELSAMTTNNDIMVSSPLTWNKSEALTSDDSVTFATPPPPPVPVSLTDLKTGMVKDFNKEVVMLEDSIANPCLVCGDKASGYHYSVFSCEGCKGFFKRSVQKGLVYTCKESSCCHINKFSRNSCQYCRFQKCLQIGMKREAVREDRSPGGKHRHKRPCLDQIGLSVLDTDDPYNGRETHSTTHVHQVRQEAATTATTAAPAATLLSSDDGNGNKHDPPNENLLLESLLSAKPHLYPKGGSEKTEGLSVNELMQYGYLELRFIIEWAKKVPGFSELGLSDQMSLLKSSFMELNVLRLAYRSMNLDNKIKFAEDVILPLDYCESIGWGKELVDGIIDFAHKLKEISLDLPEFCILNAIILMYPDAQSLDDRMRIAELQSHILDSLRHLLLQRHPQDFKRLGKILLRLPALRTVSAKAAERFLSLTFDGSVELNNLVLEMMN